MPVAAATRSRVASSGGAVVTALLGLAAAAALLLYFRPELRGSSGEGAAGGLTGIVQGVQETGRNAAQTVAQLLSLRSPGKRAAGALASLKQKKQPILHARALPKVRRPAAPPSAYPYVAGPPPPAAVPPVAAPLFNTVTAPPPAPIAQSTVPGGPGGSPIFPALPPTGGGGVVVPPPIIPAAPETPGTPETPGVPAVPEPASWAMMLVGFTMMGRMLRRGRRGLAKAALPQP